MKTSKMKWLWENMKGYHVIYTIAILGTVMYNILQLTVPFVTQKIIDLFLSGEQAAENLATKKDIFFWLILAMIGLTFLRTFIVYIDCMFATEIPSVAEYQGTLLSLYAEYRDALVMCDPDKFDALYDEYAQKYAEAGYAEITEERLQALNDGLSSRLNQ